MILSKEEIGSNSHRNIQKSTNCVLDTEYLYKQALYFCSQKSGKTEEEIIALLKQGDSWSHSTLRYALANSLCAYLAAEETTIKAVYIFGSTIKDEASFYSDIDLIFWVSKKNDKIDFLLKMADSQLAKQYIVIMGDGFKDFKGLLDFKIVNDEEVNERKSYGSVVTSLWDPPIKIWGKEQ